MKTLIYQCTIYNYFDELKYNFGLFRALPTELEFIGAMNSINIEVINFQHVAIGFTRAKFTIQSEGKLYDGDIEYLSLF